MRVYTFFLLLVSFHCTKAQYLSAIDAQSDIRQIELSLTQYHPDLYRYITKKDFNVRINHLKNKCIDSIGTKEFYAASLDIINSIKDGHLFLTPSDEQLLKEIKSDFFLPFSIKIIDYKIFIDK